MNKRNSQPTPDQPVRLLCPWLRPLSYTMSLAGVLLALLISTSLYAGTSAEEVTTTLGQNPLIQSFSAQGSDITAPPPSPDQPVPPGVPDPSPPPKPVSGNTDGAAIGRFSIATRTLGCSNPGLIKFWKETQPTNNKAYYDVYNIPLASVPNPTRQLMQVPRHRFSEAGLRHYKTLMDDVIKPLKDGATASETDQFNNSSLKMSLIYWTTALHHNPKSLAKTYQISDAQFYPSRHPSSHNQYSKEYLDSLNAGKVGSYVRGQMQQKLEFDANILDVTDEESKFYRKNKDGSYIEGFKFGGQQPAIFLPQVIGSTAASGVARYNTIGVGSAKTSTSSFELVPLAIDHFSRLVASDYRAQRSFFNNSKASIESIRNTDYFNKLLFRAYEVLALQDSHHAQSGVQSTPWRAQAHRNRPPGETIPKINTDLYEFTDQVTKIDTPPVYVTHFAVQTCRKFQSPEPLKDPYILNIANKHNLQALDIINDMRELIAREFSDQPWDQLSQHTSLTDLPEEDRKRYKPWGGAKVEFTKFKTRITDTDFSSFYGSFYGQDKKLHEINVAAHLHQFKALAQTLKLDSTTMKGNYVSAFHWFSLYTKAINKALSDVVTANTPGKTEELAEAIQSKNIQLPAAQQLKEEDITCNLSPPSQPSPPAQDASEEEKAAYAEALETFKFKQAAFEVADQFCPTLIAMKKFMKDYTRISVVGAKDSTAAKTGPSLLRLATLNVSPNTESGLSPHNPLKFGNLPGTETDALPIKAVPTLYKALSCFEIKNSLAKLYRNYKGLGPSVGTISTDPSLGLSSSYTVTNPIPTPNNAPNVPNYVGNSHKWWEHNDFGFECAYLEKHLIKMQDEDQAPYTLFHLLSGLVYDDNYSHPNGSPFDNKLTVAQLLEHWDNQKQYIERRLELIKKAVKIDNLGIILNLQPHHTKSCTHQYLTSTNPSKIENNGWGKLQSSIILDTRQEMTDDENTEELADYPYYSDLKFGFQRYYNSYHVEYDFAVNAKRQLAYRNPYYAVFASSTGRHQDVEQRIEAQEKNQLDYPVPIGQPLIAIPGMLYRSPALMSQPSEDIWITMSPRAICLDNSQTTWVINNTIDIEPEYPGDIPPSWVTAITTKFIELTRLWRTKQTPKIKRDITKKCEELVKVVEENCQFNTETPRCKKNITQEFCEKVPEHFDTTIIRVIN